MSVSGTVEKRFIPINDKGLLGIYDANGTATGDGSAGQVTFQFDLRAASPADEWFIVRDYGANAIGTGVALKLTLYSLYLSHNEGVADSIGNARYDIDAMVDDGVITGISKRDQKIVLGHKFGGSTPSAVLKVSVNTNAIVYNAWIKILVVKYRPLYRSDGMILV